ncbi:hypothetical protein [Vibrio hannami]|uniref:hypothetical protein n=1 Tax=Vibrio hannami TaxID=2717094 RepID=UPI003EC108FB
MQNSHKPIQGYAPCQHCGKPSPVYLPRGGPRKNTFYYVCPEHSNEQGIGVHDYCKTYMTSTLEEFAEKYDAEQESQALKTELENSGALITEVETASTDETSNDAVKEEITEENLLIDNDTGEAVETASQTDKKDGSNQSASGIVLVVIFGLLLICGGGYALYRKLKKPVESVNTSNTPQTPAKPQPAKPETEQPKGVLL